MKTIHRYCIYFLLASLLLAGCAGIENPVSVAALTTPGTVPLQSDPTADCPVTQPEWVKPPEDTAVMNPPEFGYYIMNADRSILASAWWFENEDYPLRAGKDGNKIGWFRPAGAELEITGRRLDAQAPPLEAHASCCYPTRFQASGVYFPAPGCWEVTARADNSLLKFMVLVEP
jgi:hypothetical protein